MLILALMRAGVRVLNEPSRARPPSLSPRGSTAGSRVAGHRRPSPATLDVAVGPRHDNRAAGRLRPAWIGTRDKCSKRPLRAASVGR